MQQRLSTAERRAVAIGWHRPSAFCGVSCPEPFRVEAYPEHDRVRVAPIGELDLTTAGPLDDLLRELLDTGFDHLVLDLGGVSFMDCSGLRVLRGAWQRASETGTRLDVRGARGQVKRLLALTGADQPLHLVAHPLTSPPAPKAAQS